jgi:hypothetical protein
MPLHSRVKASAIHLCISLGVAIVAAVVVYAVWYPGRLSVITDITAIFLLLLICDVILGPVLTGVIYDARKANLKFDLAIVAFIQIAALSYGLHTVWVARPAFLVYSVGRFDLVSANRLLSLQQGRPSKLPPHEAPWFGPKIVGAVMPSEASMKSALVDLATDGKGDLQNFPQFYVQAEVLRENMLKASVALERLSAPQRSVAVNELSNDRHEANDARWVYARANAVEFSMRISTSSAKQYETSLVKLD